MIRTNAKGVVLTGIGAYLILSKGISALRGMVRDISEAKKWKAYYECRRPNPLAPGYERKYTVPQYGNTQSTDGGDPRKIVKQGTPTESLGRAVGDAVVKMINEVFGIEDKAKKPLVTPEINRYSRYRDLYKKPEPETRDEPFIITKEEFFNERDEYDKATIDWWANEDRIYDDCDNPIYDAKPLLGELVNLKVAFTLNPDMDEEPDILYVRNDQMCTDFEIIRHLHDVWENEPGQDTDGDDIAPITPLHMAEEQKNIPATNEEKDEDK